MFVQEILAGLDIYSIANSKIGNVYNSYFTTRSSSI